MELREGGATEGKEGGHEGVPDRLLTIQPLSVGLPMTVEPSQRMKNAITLVATPEGDPAKCGTQQDYNSF